MRNLTSSNSSFLPLHMNLLHSNPISIIDQQNNNHQNPATSTEDMTMNAPMMILPSNGNPSSKHITNILKYQDDHNNSLANHPPQPLSTQDSSIQSSKCNLASIVTEARDHNKIFKGETFTSAINTINHNLLQTIQAKPPSLFLTPPQHQSKGKNHLVFDASQSGPE